MENIYKALLEDPRMTGQAQTFARALQAGSYLALHYARDMPRPAIWSALTDFWRRDARTRAMLQNLKERHKQQGGDNGRETHLFVILGILIVLYLMRGG